MLPTIQINQLRISNFATIESQEIEFTEGFNAIVGETGSGKSLILNAFNILLGSKADKKYLRHGSDFYTVEGTFSCPDQKLKDFFQKHNIFIQDEFTIKRVVYKEGSSKSFVDLQNIPANIIRSFSLEFFDIIGQHENQKLLQNNYQLRLLDIFANQIENLNQYNKPFLELKENNKLLSTLEEKISIAERQIDYLDFQINQIEELSPTVEEEDDLILSKEKIQKLMASQKTISEISSLLSDGQGSILSQVSSLKNLFSQIDLSEQLAEKITLLDSNISDISYEFSKMNTEHDSDNELEDIIDRLDAYQKLKRKFKTDTIGLVSQLNEFQKERNEYKNIQNLVDQTKQTISDLRNQLWKISTDLHQTRLNEAPKLSKGLIEKFKKINLNECLIKFDLKETDEFLETGRTNIKTLIRTNPGEEFQEIHKIASGGELSRILLSFRTCCKDPESISIFLFDEVDAGLGGKTAKKIGELISEISLNAQVIAITHLPQIATFADNIIHVFKATEGKAKDRRTWTRAEKVLKSKKDQFLKEMTPL